MSRGLTAPGGKRNAPRMAVIWSLPFKTATGPSALRSLSRSSPCAPPSPPGRFWYWSFLVPPSLSGAVAGGKKRDPPKNPESTGHSTFGMAGLCIKNEEIVGAGFPRPPAKGSDFPIECAFPKDFSLRDGKPVPYDTVSLAGSPAIPFPGWPVSALCKDLVKTGFFCQAVNILFTTNSL